MQEDCWLSREDESMLGIMGRHRNALKEKNVTD